MIYASSFGNSVLFVRTGAESHCISSIIIIIIGHLLFIDHWLSIIHRSLVIYYSSIIGYLLFIDHLFIDHWLSIIFLPALNPTAYDRFHRLQERNVPEPGEMGVTQRVPTLAPRTRPMDGACDGQRSATQSTELMA